MKTASAILILGLLWGPAHAQTRPAGGSPPPRPATGSTSTQPRPASGEPGPTGDTRPATPAPTGTSGSGRAAGAAVSPDYRLVAGDKLRIEVYREEQLSQSVEVRPDGRITLPLVGDVVAAGITPRDLASTLTEQLREYVTTPVVTVIVAEATPPMIYVMGEVNAPGAQPMRTPITVMQALAVAGGFKEFANPKKIRILRKGASGTVDTIRFNYKEALESTASPLLLQPGDTVVVP